MSKKNFFMIITAGATGSMWIAKSLNNYADVFCYHGFNLNKMDTKYDPNYQLQNFKKFHEKDPEDYFNGIKTKFNKNIVELYIIIHYRIMITFQMN